MRLCSRTRFNKTGIEGNATMASLKITIDFETRSRANLKKTGAYEYSLDPSTISTCLAFKTHGNPKVHLFKFHQMQRPYKLHAPDFQVWWKKKIKEGYLFSAHNAFFEQCIYNNVLVKRFGWPEIPPHLWRCTAAKAAAVAIPRNLAGAGEVMRLSVQKDPAGYQAMMATCKPTRAFNAYQKLKLKKYKNERDLAKLAEPPPPEFLTPEAAPEVFNVLYKYCKIDVVTEELLDDSLPDLIPDEQEMWLLDQKINFRGTRVDMPLVNKISDLMAKEQKVMEKELDVLTMGLVSSGKARMQIMDFLSLEGIEIPDLKAKTVDDFLENGKVTGDAKKLLLLRKKLAKASTAKYQAFKNRAASDGRVRDMLLYHGASTGRWGGAGVQPQNFPRGTVKDIYEAIHQINTCEDVRDLKMLYGENLMPLFASVLRGMFIASDGHELFVQDWNAIETRVLWWLAGHKKGLDIFREGRDPYWEMARKIFKFDKNLRYDETDLEHSNWRQVGKAAVLGCGYQMGWRKFITSAWDVYRAYVTPEIAKIAVSAYRELHSSVKQLWDDYQLAAINAIQNKGAVYPVGLVKFFYKNNFLWVELPSGRRLAYNRPSVMWEKVEIKNDDGVVENSFDAQKIKFWGIWKGKNWVLESTYGGKLCENIVQAVSRDLLRDAIKRSEKSNYLTCFHSHDELVVEAPKGKRKSEDFQKVMETLPKWATGLPLKAGGWVGERYRKG
jgi:DNA polymerase